MSAQRELAQHLTDLEAMMEAAEDGADDDRRFRVDWPVAFDSRPYCALCRTPLTNFPGSGHVGGLVVYATEHAKVCPAA